MAGQWDNDNGLTLKKLSTDYFGKPGTTRLYGLPNAGADADIMLTPTQTALGQVLRIPLTRGRNNDLTVLDATGGSGKVKLNGTIGTDLNLQGQAAQNNTKTGQVLFEVTLPAQYRAGNDLTLTVNVQRVVAAGTTLTTSIDAELWKMGVDGTAGSDLCATAVQAFTNTAAAELTFTITGTTLAAGDRLLLRLTTVATEGGNAGTVLTQVNSARLS